MKAGAATLGIGASRLVRHAVAPLVILAVERGWLPASVKGDVTEFIIIGLSLILAYGWSYWNEHYKAGVVLVDGQQDSPDGDSGPCGTGCTEAAGSKPEEEGPG